MTVEQKAEEYTEENGFGSDCNNLTSYDANYEIEQAFIDGYHECEKEHEWHRVLDGDFPKHNNEVLCLLWGGTKEIGYYKNELWYFEDFTADKDDVDYWQEIKLPKE